MKKTILVVLLLILYSGSLFAQAKKDQTDYDRKETFGFLFGIQSITSPVQNSSNSVISGIGGKYFIFSELAIRALFFVNVDYNSAADVTITRGGLSAGVEYHFINGIVSPYTGGFLGIEILNDATGLYADYHGGAMLGVEINVLEYLSFFVEYNLVVVINQDGVELNLGYESGGYARLPLFGFVIYIQ